MKVYLLDSFYPDGVEYAAERAEVIRSAVHREAAHADVLADLGDQLAPPQIDTLAGGERHRLTDVASTARRCGGPL